MFWVEHWSQPVSGFFRCIQKQSFLNNRANHKLHPRKTFVQWSLEAGLTCTHQPWANQLMEQSILQMPTRQENCLGHRPHRNWFQKWNWPPFWCDTRCSGRGCMWRLVAIDLWSVLDSLWQHQLDKASRLIQHRWNERHCSPTSITMLWYIKLKIFS